MIASAFGTEGSIPQILDGAVECIIEVASMFLFFPHNKANTQQLGHSEDNPCYPSPPCKGRELSSQLSVFHS